VRNLLILMMFGVFFMFAACNTNTPLDKVTLPEIGPTGLSEQQFEDVPSPEGFRLVTRRSFSYEVGSLRLGSFRYEGERLSPKAALRYYTTEMVRPLYGWSLVENPARPNQATLRKGRNDEARVYCKKVGEVTRVTVNVNFSDDAPRTRQ
jgi:hypothetical protein